MGKNSKTNFSKEKKQILVLTGCTASGKSSLALELAKEINGVIINADSRQIYKEISIGTAKPIPDKVENDIWYIENIPHLLYSYISIKEDFNLYRYQQDVFNLLKKLPKEVTPILVGGTGLYIDAVVFNYKLKKHSEKKDQSKREKLQKKDVDQLQKIVGTEKLSKLNISDQNNPHRLIQIIEKGSLPSIEKGEELKHKYFFLDVPKDILNRNIERRVEEMFENGLLEENIEIRKKGLDKYPALSTIGYQEFEKYFKKAGSLEEVKEDIIIHTRQYAKRQRTWFRRNKNVIYVKNLNNILKNI